MATSERSARRTIDHKEIQQWVERRGGHPAAVQGTGSGDDPGILRIDFPGYSGEGKLESIPWDVFFTWFDKNELAFIYQDVDDSRFNKLVSRSASDRRKRSGGRKEEASSGRKDEKQGARVPSSASKEGEGPGPAGNKGQRRNGIDAIRLLEQQHRQVEALFAEYEDANSDRGEVFNHIADAVAAHSEIEERIFYPTVYSDKTEEELREAVEEHLAVKRVIADLLQMEPEDPQYDSKVQVMRELFEHHVEEEEHRLFPMLGKVEKNDLLVLGARMKSAWDHIIDQEPRREVPKHTAHAAPLGG